MDVSESSRLSSITHAAQGDHPGKCFESTRTEQVSNQSIISARSRRTPPLSRGLAFAAAALTALALSACATRPPATALDRRATHALRATADTPLRTALAPKAQQGDDRGQPDRDRGRP